MSPSQSDAAWWRQASVYQIYPRSFCDANGDGIGDLKGIISKVDYLKKLGVDAIWLSPFYPSALKDGGYDVADYRDIDPRIGTLAEFDEMSQKLKEVGIRVIVDIVPNHCSDDHVWFQEALKAAPGSDARKKFIFKDGIGENKDQPPNDWQCVFGGSAWEQVSTTDGTPGQFYLHIFDSSQPDFDWTHPEVREDFHKTLRFWGDRGVSGFRIDVAHGLAKNMSEPYASQAELNQLLTDMHNDKVAPNSHPLWDRDEVHEIYAGWRKVFNEYNPPLTAVAEAWVSPTRKHLYASPEGLGQSFSFDMLMCPYNAAKYKETIDESLKQVKDTDSSTTWVLSNHDVIRHATRYGIAESTVAESVEDYSKYNKDYLHSNGAKPSCDLALGLKRARAASVLLLGLPGSAYLYQGEELGLPEVVEIPAEKRQDPIFFRHKGAEIGRDGCRVPLPWTSAKGSYGFSPESSDVEPHLPPPSFWGEFAADKQDQEKASTLALYQQALKLRSELQTKESLEWIDLKNDDVVAFKRPNGWTVVLNFGKESVDVSALGELVLASGELDGGKVPTDTSVWIKGA